MKLTKETLAKLEPLDRNSAYSIHSFPIRDSEHVFTWSHPDDQYTITLDLEAKTITGRFYDWCDTTEEWVDAAEPMTDAEIIHYIQKNRLILVAR